MEKLGESGESDAVRARHRDHYTRLAVLLDQPSSAGQREHVEQAESEIDNLRAAFTWSCDTGDAGGGIATGVRPAAAVAHPSGASQEGLSWINVSAV